jgi:hypothetical protein
MRCCYLNLILLLTEGSPSPPRRFHNIYDAAKWIEQNWPDFDLESNHPITWRGELR